MLIPAIICSLCGFAAGYPLAALGFFFPDKKDLKGSFKKAGDRKFTTLLTIVFTGLLSFAAGFFAPSVFLAVVYTLLTFALVVIFTVDFRTYEIPFSVNVFIFALGIIRFAIEPGDGGHLRNLPLYIIGFFAVSLPLALIYYISKGRAIGFGDVKMMASCGLLLGWKCIILSLIIGCILGSIIHLIRMKVKGEGAVLAMGPYLAMGVYISTLAGNLMISAYLSLLHI